MQKLFVFLIAALMTFPVIAKDDKGNKAGGKRAEYQGPAVDQYEQHDLERQ